jgi:hypothetical protein
VLTLREPQVEALRAAAVEALVCEIARELRQSSRAAAASLDEWGLRDAVRRTVARAADFGLTSEPDARGLVELTVRHGWDFEDAWLVARLRDQRVTSPAERLRLALAESGRRIRVAERNAFLRDLFAPPEPAS